jgi:hypothetical protein
MATSSETTGRLSSPELRPALEEEILRLLTVDIVALPDRPRIAPESR